MKRYFLLLLIIVQSCKILSQQQSLEFLTDRLTYHNYYALITIKHYAERYTSSEVNLIYISGNRIKIHSILKTPDFITDTMFVMSGPQIMLLDQFDKDLRENKIIPKEIVVAGSRTEFEIIAGDTPNYYINKSGYSLINELLKLK